MLTVFISPSTQEYNLYSTERNEEQRMNEIADAMEPYLNAAGINYVRNDPALTVGGSVRLSNNYGLDVHLALHSNAAPPALAGQLRGSDVYYYRGSAQGEALARLIAADLAVIYPLPEKVNIVPNRTLYELVNTQAPAVLVELAYHDNIEDALWITENTDAIARQLVLALTQYFGIPFVLPDTLQRGTLITPGFAVNLRDRPDYAAAATAMIPNGSSLIITGQSGAWYVVSFEGQVGYVPKQYITLE